MLVKKKKKLFFERSFYALTGRQEQLLSAHMFIRIGMMYLHNNDVQSNGNLIETHYYLFKDPTCL